MRCSNCGSNGPTVEIVYVVTPREANENVCEPCAHALIMSMPNIWCRKPVSA